MNKPDDVSAEAWEEAKSRTTDIERRVWGDDDFLAVCEAIARAIDAAIAKERDACALIAEKWKRPEQPIHKQMEVLLPFMVADDIGRKIRSRGDHRVL